MASRGKLPILAFGTREDFDVWTDGVGTPVVTTGTADPFGGTDAFTVDDSDGAVQERLDSLSFTLTPNADGEAIVEIYVKKGTSDRTNVDLHDTDANAERHKIKITWSGAVPSIATDLGAGTLFTPVKVTTDDWYLVRFSATNIVAAANHKIFLEPAGVNAADTGTILVYGRSTILFGYFLDSANAWSEPREGSEFAMSPGGAEDAWIVARDYILSGLVRWIPPLDLNAPANLTGWDGRLEHKMVNVGWDALLAEGRDKGALTWVPDQSVVGTSNPTLLRDPLKGKPNLEDDATRSFDVVLRASDDKPFEGF